MNQMWNGFVGTVLIVAVILLIVALAFFALVDGEDWDDDAGKGE